ncbi:MAG: 1-deoxy-D-xylulose-5-phosphate reductoisomerase [Actinomycetes bacterium]
MTSVRAVTVLGSTGSVGSQALALAAAHPGRFRVVALAAGGADVALLARQALAHRVQVVAVADESRVTALHAALDDAHGTVLAPAPRPRVLAGAAGVTEVAAWPADVVLNAITGSVGLAPTLASLAAGRTLALANKESLIAGGPLVRAAARPGQIVPVDSEHSAIAQCLRAGSAGEVRRLVITASGGPFRGFRRDELAGVTPQQSLAHPTWRMGPVITVNSATLVNKGLEVIEAHVLFDVPIDRIDVVVHPQSVVHSMVEYVDGSTIAQASPPDMALAIAVGLGWPDRVPEAASGCDWACPRCWEFAPLDEEVFDAIRLARHAATVGGTAPAVLNASNEEAVHAFLGGRLGFLGITETIATVLDDHLAGGVQPVRTTAEVIEAEAWARARAQALIAGHERTGTAS